jgi:hypothetical protein
MRMIAITIVLNAPSSSPLTKYVSSTNLKNISCLVKYWHKYLLALVHVIASFNRKWCSLSSYSRKKKAKFPMEA